MKKISALLVLILMFLLISYVHAQSPQQTLTQYISDLQKNPNDYALREKIIKHVQTMKPAPAIPEGAERYMARGGAAVKAAKNEKDFQDAALEFEKASLTAPWLAAAYYNLGITQDKAGKYREAIQSLKLYLLAAPEASDAKAVKTLVYEIEYRQEKAAKESSPEAVAAKKEKEQQDFLKKINGARYICHYPGPVEDIDFTLDVLGDTITGGQCKTRSTDRSERKVGVWEKTPDTYKIEGRTLRCFMMGQAMESMTGIISDDGSTITVITRAGRAESRLVYRRMR
jgi:tetratricopeptide (TPR) repeat protein